MIVHDRSAGHGYANIPAHRVGVVFVFDAAPLVQGVIKEAGHIPGGIDVRITSPQGANSRRDGQEQGVAVRARIIVAIRAP